MSADQPVMTVEMSRALARLTDVKRCRVLERSAIIREATGCSWLEADERALAEEAGVGTQRELVR